MDFITDRFTVTITDQEGVSVRVFPGVDTGESVIFTKTRLEAELADLFRDVYASGAASGRESIQNRFCDMMGVRR